MRDELGRFIEENLLSTRFPEGVTPETDLLTSGLLDSLGVMQLVWFIEKRFSIDVPAGDVTIEHFQTIEKIARYLEDLSGG